MTPFPSPALDLMALQAEGRSHHEAGRLPEAEAVYRRILAVEPGNADILHRMAVLAVQADKPETAVTLFGWSLRFNSGDAAAWSNLCATLRQLGRLDEAIIAGRAAVETDSRFAEGYNNLANALMDQRQFAEAIAPLSRYILLRPHAPAQLFQLAHALIQLGRYAEAETVLQDLVRRAPHDAAALANLGVTLKNLGRHDEAILTYRRSLEVAPTDPRVINNMGLALSRMNGREDESVIWLRRAVRVAPAFADALVNLALAFQRQNRFDEAMELCRRAIAAAPEHPEAHTLLATCLLAKGDLGAGFEEYEWRTRLPDFPSPPRAFPMPAWDGTDLANRTVLVHDEQGLGDGIQFIRYAQMLHRRGARVIVECAPLLHRLFSSMTEVDTVIARFAPAPPCDFHVPLLSLPHRLGTTRNTIPAASAYLSAEPRLVKAWRKRLGRRPGSLRVGLIWAGNPDFKHDSERSPGLAAMLPLLGVDGIQIFALQKGSGREDLAALRDRLPASFTDLGDEIGDFADTAAIMMSLDLIVSSCTAPAHLAGALGRPVWTILPFHCDWRWLDHGDSTPWYPTMRLFRQDRPGDWTAIIDRVRTGLGEAAALRKTAGAGRKSGGPSSRGRRTPTRG